MNPPVSRRPASGRWVENSGAGQVLYTPQAAVPDVSGDSVAYRLTGADAGGFTVDSGTGALTLTGDPDFEAKAGYSVVVTAVTREGESDEQSAAQAVTVVVGNRSDSPPLFASTAVAWVEENGGAGQVAYTPVAAVPDVSGDGVEYRLSGPDAASFMIDASTGALTLTGEPDYETKAGYSVVVTAVTGAGGVDEQSASQAVTVVVMDGSDIALARAGTQAALPEGTFGAETATGYGYSVEGVDLSGAEVRGERRALRGGVGRAPGGPGGVGVRPRGGRGVGFP